MNTTIIRHITVDSVIEKGGDIFLYPIKIGFLKSWNYYEYAGEVI